MQWGIAAAAFAFYWFTRVPGVCPGSSGVATVSAMNILPTALATHPFFLLAARAVAMLPIGDAVPRLGTFSALCGCLSVALLFRVSVRLYHALTSEPIFVRLVPHDDELDELARSGEPETAADDSRDGSIAIAGGAVAAVAFAFSVPVWIASTALYIHSFDLLLLLLLTDLLIRYHQTGSVVVGATAVFLLCACSVESVVFVVLAPIALGFIVWTGIRFKQMSESYFLLFFVVGLVGLFAALGLVFALSTPDHAVALARAKVLLVKLVHAHFSEFSGSLPSTGWAVVLFQTTAPLALAVMALYKLSPLQDSTNNLKWNVAGMLATAFTVACLMNAPHTAWAYARQENRLPVYAALSIALAAGALFTYWAQLTSAWRSEGAVHGITVSVVTRLISGSLCTLLAIAVLRSVPANIGEADGRQCAFADKLAEIMLRQAGPAQCLVTDGTIDMNLLVMSHLSKQKRIIVPLLSSPASTTATAREGQVAPAARTRVSNHPQTQAFIEQWIVSHPGQAEQVAAVAGLDIWQRSGFTPVPLGLVCSGIQDIRNVPHAEILEANRKAWSELTPFIVDESSLRLPLRRLREQARKWLSRSANDLGVIAERLGDALAADEAYAEALRVDSCNVSALLNRYGLHLQSADRGSSAKWTVLLMSRIAQPGFLDNLNRNLEQSGQVAKRMSDTLIPAFLRDLGLNASPTAPMLQLLDIWLTKAGDRHVATLPDPVRNDTSAKQDSRLPQAFSMMLAGKPSSAEKLLKLLVREKPDHVSGWALLAEIQLNRGALAEVEHTVLPAMRKATSHGADTTLTDITEASLLLKMSPPRLVEARTNLLHAIDQNPQLESVIDLLFNTDRQLGDLSLLEADALHLIDRVPDHATANALLGGLHLSRKELGKAEVFLRRSIMNRPTAAAQNDLAELLRQSRRLAEAENFSRASIRTQPNFYQAWDTLGSVLLDSGRTTEASEALRCALIFGPKNDVRPALSLARLRIKEGREPEAKKILAQLSPLPRRTSSEVRSEYDLLLHQLDGVIHAP